MVSQQLSRDASTQTIPILIYTSARRGPFPSLNPLATLTLPASTPLIVVAAVVYRRFIRAERRAA